MMTPTQEDINVFVYAGCTGDKEILERMLAVYGADIINARDDKIQACALTWAAATGRQDIVAYLLDQGADIEAHGTEERTALGYAATGGHVELVKFLLERGASLDAKDIHGRNIIAQLDNSFGSMTISDTHKAIKDFLENRRREEERKIAEAEERRQQEQSRAQLDLLSKRRPHNPLKKHKPGK